MRNEKGNVIALVLLILAVVSLVGAGALMMSRYDLRFTGALKSYDKGFNLADGGATVGYRDLAKRDREQAQSMTADYTTNPPTPFIIYCHCVDPGNCASETAKATCARCIDRAAGNYDVTLQIVDYRTSSTLQPGWEAGSFYNEYWNGSGVASRAPAQSGAWKTANATVQTNVSKTKQTGK
jgi:Tfp pilus assembly protein PilX